MLPLSTGSEKQRMNQSTTKNAMISNRLPPSVMIMVVIVMMIAGVALKILSSYHHHDSGGGGKKVSVVVANHRHGDEASLEDMGFNFEWWHQKKNDYYEEDHDDRNNNSSSSRNHMIDSSDEDDNFECHEKEFRPRKIFNVTTNDYYYGEEEEEYDAAFNHNFFNRTAINAQYYESEYNEISRGSSKKSGGSLRTTTQQLQQQKQATTSSGGTTTTTTVRLGDLTHSQHGVRLSRGLKAKIIARSGQRVTYHDGRKSSRQFHDWPDFGACFSTGNDDDGGGWVYVSNSEVNQPGWGGVGGIYFDREGRILRYDHLLSGTTMNCGGGKTPWNTWISCEETLGGQLWQVDPLGKRSPERIRLGKEGGVWESFAYDYRDPQRPSFFVTEDKVDSAGRHDYLLLRPTPGSGNERGTFTWTEQRLKAKHNANQYYPFSEGLDVHGDKLYFVCKKKQWLFELNLDTNQYVRSSKRSALFDGEPDQISRLLLLSAKDDHDGNGMIDSDFLFFTEDNGNMPGVFGRNKQGKFFTILQGNQFRDDETTGLAFSPNGKHMYVAYQKKGILLDITREDGLAFQASSLNIKYHGM